MTRRLIVIIALALAALAHPGAAQQGARADTLRAGEALLEVRLLDGSVIYGRIESVTESELAMVSVSGARITVPRQQIRSARVTEGRVRGNAYWPRDPTGTRLFFGATGRSLRAGEGSFGVFELIAPTVSYGITDALSVSGGIPIIPDNIGELSFVAAKLRLLRAPRAQVAAGVFGLVGVEEVDFAGLFYGTGTFGTEDDAVTVAASVPFYRDSDGSADVDSYALLMLGGETRVSRRLKLLTENYWDTDEGDVILSGGARILGDRLTADFGLGVFVGDPVECCVPLVNFTYTFGK